MNTPMTPGITKTVAWLNALGFGTTDSGDGVTNVEAGMECALDVPNVAIVVLSDDLADEADRLVYHLQKAGVPLVAFGQGEGASIQASYDPVDGTAVILLLGVDDAALDTVAAGKGDGEHG